jgi:hypothetical protein
VAKKIIFTGCSFTAGDGWLQPAPELWVNLCHSNIPKFNSLELLNLGQSGASNTEIFANTVRALGQYGAEIDTLFVQWTATHRYNLQVGFELWDTSESFNVRKLRTHDIHTSSGTWSRDYVDDLLNRFKALHHYHWEIMQIVDYTNIIAGLSDQQGIQTYFVNGLCPWDTDYFLELHDVEPCLYTEFTRNHVLDMDKRTDADLLQLYKQAHYDYRSAGGVDHSRWVNLYNSFKQLQIDNNWDGRHPGAVSNQLYYRMIADILT